MRRFIIWGFGILLLSMAICQLTTFGYFNHIIYTYMNPVGEGAKPLSLFVTPAALAIVVLEIAGAVGLLGLSDENTMKPAFIKMGAAAMLIWFVLILTILVRGAPINSVGFFGERLRQDMNWLILLQSMVFIAWSWIAYMLTEQDEA